MRSCLFLLLLGSLCFTACKKKVDVEPGAPSINIVIQQTQIKLRHNWAFDHSVLNDYVPMVASDTIHGQTGDYFDFKVNNLCYSYWSGLYDTVNYQVLSASRMIYGGDTMTIKTLDATRFAFFKKVKTATVHYDNEIGLSK